MSFGVNRVSEKRLLGLRNALAGLFFLEKGRLSARKEYFDSAVACLGAEKDHNLLEAVVVTAYTILRERGENVSQKVIAAWFRDQRRRKRTMAQTMREYLERIGLERGRHEGLESALAAMRRALRRRGINPEAYEQDLEGLTAPGKVVDLVASFMAAKNPQAYLRRRFGH